MSPRNYYSSSLLITCSIIMVMSIFQTATAEEAVLEVMNPVATIKVQRIVPVERPESLDNKRILLYWNRKLHADVAVDEIRKQLQKRIKGAQYTIIQGTAWHPEPGFYEEILAWRPDVVIASTGD